MADKNSFQPAITSPLISLPKAFLGTLTVIFIIMALRDAHITMRGQAQNGGEDLWDASVTLGQKAQYTKASIEAPAHQSAWKEASIAPAAKNARKESSVAPASKNARKESNVAPPVQQKKNRKEASMAPAVQKNNRKESSVALGGQKAAQKESSVGPAGKKTPAIDGGAARGRKTPAIDAGVEGVEPEVGPWLGEL
ncbi:hypothetical protein P280DRAFT_470172 [Massarina eburnea CBS 473.64]|uniref:Uncharacterized protein n=1 Tax=Massarina eburnea CBS 473.64 TaxID=1395130 RepID=A0A6A6RVG3_9PLEO|nr:hypothetical protein P280DRAFT_470172 [Massarina eburnea CBS 473.64]